MYIIVYSVWHKTKKKSEVRLCYIKNSHQGALVIWSFKNSFFLGFFSIRSSADERFNLAGIVCDCFIALVNWFVPIHLSAPNRPFFTFRQLMSQYKHFPVVSPENFFFTTTKTISADPLLLRINHSTLTSFIWFIRHNLLAFWREYRGKFQPVLILVKDWLVYSRLKKLRFNRKVYVFLPLFF